VRGSALRSLRTRLRPSAARSEARAALKELFGLFAILRGAPGSEAAESFTPQVYRDDAFDLFLTLEDLCDEEHAAESVAGIELAKMVRPSEPGWAGLG
jgi:hypothetical protein